MKDKIAELSRLYVQLIDLKQDFFKQLCDVSLHCESLFCGAWYKRFGNYPLIQSTTEAGCFAVGWEGPGILLVNAEGSRNNSDVRHHERELNTGDVVEFCAQFEKETGVKVKIYQQQTPYLLNEDVED